MDTLQAALENNLTLLAKEGDIHLAIPNKSGLTRAQVIETFQTAFEMIGGVPRLALWADDHPGEFYKLYGRLLPSSSTTELDGDQVIRVVHSLPPPRPYHVIENEEPSEDDEVGPQHRDRHVENDVGPAKADARIGKTRRG